MGEKGLFSTGADAHTAPYPLLGLPDAAPPAAAPVKRTTSRQSSFASLHKYKSSDGNMMEVLAKGLGDEGEQLNLAMLNELAMLGGDAAGLGVEGGKADGGGSSGEGRPEVGEGGPGGVGGASLLGVEQSVCRSAMHGMESGTMSGAALC